MESIVYTSDLHCSLMKCEVLCRMFCRLHTDASKMVAAIVVDTQKLLSISAWEGTSKTLKAFGESKKFRISVHVVLILRSNHLTEYGFSSRNIWEIWY